MTKTVLRHHIVALYTEMYTEHVTGQITYRVVVVRINHQLQGGTTLYRLRLHKKKPAGFEPATSGPATAVHTTEPLVHVYSRKI